MSFLKNLLLVLQGALVGSGAILPGVSGGVLCATFGIYEPMMAFLAHPFSSFKKYIRILLPVAIGGGLGFVVIAKGLDLLFSASPTTEMSVIVLFCGLICGTIPDLSKKATVESDPKKGWIAFALVLSASFFFFQFLKDATGASIAPNFGWYVVCGLLWGLSMVAPGLSSSSILMFIGLYEPMSAGIGNLDFSVIVPLGLGFLAALAASARPINYCLEHFPAYVSKIILAFVLSSLLMLVDPVPFDLKLWSIGLACFAAGFALSLWMNSLSVEEKK